MHPNTFNKPICIFSCGIKFSLSEKLQQYTEQADYIYGSQKLLACLPKHHAKEIAISAKAHEQAQEILTLAARKKILVLCSGDCLYHGFGSTLINLAPKEERGKLFAIIPDITAFQVLCAKCCLPWQEAELFTAHFQEELPLRKMANSKLAIIYGGTKYPAHKIAREILAFSPQQKKRRGISAEELGTPKEKIVQATLEEIAKLDTSPTSILVLLPFKNIEKNILTRQKENCLTLGLDEEIYAKENNLITHSDCRAVILSRLCLEKEGVFWDLGAGSGAVGLEAAGLTNMQVFGVEKKDSRLAHIQKNKQNLGISNYTLVHGNMLKTIPTLPKADRIFIGGGGKDIPAVLDSCKQYANKNARIIASCVTLETYSLLYAYTNLNRVDLLQINISSEQEFAKNHHHFKASNTLYLFIFENNKQD